MAFVKHPLEGQEKSLRDYASPWYEDIKLQKSGSRLEMMKYEIKTRIVEMAATNPFRGVEMNNLYRHIERFTML
jgi:hypothetical protein